MYSFSTRFDIRNRFLFGKKNPFLSHLGSGSNPYGMLLSRNCPTSLRFNIEADRCDYPQNVKCHYP